MSQRKRKTAFHLDIALAAFWLAFLIVTLLTATPPSH